MAEQRDSILRPAILKRGNALRLGDRHFIYEGEPLFTRQTFRFLHALEKACGLTTIGEDVRAEGQSPDKAERMTIGLCMSLGSIRQPHRLLGIAEHPHELTGIYFNEGAKVVAGELNPS